MIVTVLAKHNAAGAMTEHSSQPSGVQVTGPSLRVFRVSQAIGAAPASACWYHCAFPGL